MQLDLHHGKVTTLETFHVVVIMEQVIGVVSELNGSVTAEQPDGSKRQLSIGSEIYEGDSVATNDIGALTITFNDETSFSIGQDSAIVIDEYIYDPSTNDGSHKFSALKGLFVFVSGLLADDHPEDVAIDTPAGTIGIRGTVITGSIGAESTDAGVQITFVQGAGYLDSAVSGIIDLAGTFASVRVENDQVRTFVLEGDDLESFVQNLGEAGVRTLQTAAPEVDWATVIPVVTGDDATPTPDANDAQSDTTEPDASTDPVSDGAAPPPAAPAPEPEPANNTEQPTAPDDQANATPTPEPVSSPSLSTSAPNAQRPIETTSTSNPSGRDIDTPATSTLDAATTPTNATQDTNTSPSIERTEDVNPPKEEPVDEGLPVDQGPPEDRGPPEKDPVDQGPPEDRGPPEKDPVDQGPPDLIDLPTLQPPADPPLSPPPPVIQLLEDTGIDGSDGVSTNGIIIIDNLAPRQHGSIRSMAAQTGSPLPMQTSSMGPAISCPKG